MPSIWTPQPSVPTSFWPPWPSAMDETVGHLQRTAATVEAVARSLGWDETRVRWTTFGALLHDIGKIGVAPQVMRKPGPLSDSEQAAMRDHVVYGTHLVSAYGFPPLVARIVREHHERLDGSGYPMGLQSEDICEEARLVMLADIADAMLSRRAYKQALTLDDVRRALEAGAGTCSMRISSSRSSPNS